MAIGAFAGGFIGNIADQPSSSPEQQQWTALMRDIDELVRKLLESEGHSHDCNDYLKPEVESEIAQKAAERKGAA